MNNYKRSQVDIVFCCLNNPDDLLVTITSIKAFVTSKLDIRLICIDSSESNEVKKVFEGFSNLFSSDYIWTEPAGIYRAMNLAISCSRSNSYLWFLNPGDFLVDRPESVGVIEKIFYQLHDDYFVLQAKSVEGKDNWFPNPQVEINLKNILLGKFQISHQTFFISKKAALSLRGFENRYSICADLYMIAKAFQTQKGSFIFEPLVVFDQTGVSHRNRFQTIWQTLKISMRLDKVHIFLYIFDSIFKVIKLIRFRLKKVFFQSKNT
jgi:glycosyltransferase involved in cell wall biosynthesis